MKEGRKGLTRKPCQSLRSLFEELNRKYFGGRLPRYNIKMTNLTKMLVLGWCRKSKREILLSESLVDKGLRDTLLHEMIHVWSNDLEHGPAFRRGLRRLALMGEAWASNEIETYREFEKDQVFKRRIKKRWELDVAEVIENLAMNNPDTEWIKVRRYLVRDYQILQWEFLKLAPWAKGYWQHKASAVKRYRAMKERVLGKSESSSRLRS